MSLAVQILAALDTLAREERERAELGAHLEALVKMLLSMFESGEFLRFLRFSSDFAAGVRDLVEWQRNAQVRQVAGVVTRLRGQVKPGAGV